MKTALSTFLCVLLFSLPLRPSFAQTTRIEDLCAVAAIEAERILEIPAYLLQAIALTESGRWDKQKNRLKPWPWAVGAIKKSWYFSTKTEAIEHVKKLQKQGTTNIDIGCMQINLHYHGHTFADLDEAFNPINNVAYAGIFLFELFKIKKSWNEAVKFYHSANPKFNRRYIQVVYKSWQQLREQAKDNHPNNVEIGLIEPQQRAERLPDQEENIHLQNNEKHREAQSILQDKETKKQQEKTLFKDLIRYDAFARVAAAQQMQREFDLNLDNVPPPIFIPEQFLEALDN